MAPAASAATSVAPITASTQPEARQPSTGAAAAGPSSTPARGYMSSTPVRIQSKGTSPSHPPHLALPRLTQLLANFSPGADATDPQHALSYNTAPDGRVRNPVPSKLKGMADNKNGNFGVMHMDLTKPETLARDAAAKRTSESTAAAAKRASMNGYQSVKRSQLAWRPYDALSPQTPPHFQAQGASATAQEPLSHPRPSPASGSPSAPLPAQSVGQSSGQPRPAPPANAETPANAQIPSHVTKTEQARLLTLLRSLHPILVVDQLCKALAYFGGIPGAPPPTDGKFPESAAINGSGSLFVGWLAEIFPPVDGSASHGLFTTPTQPPASSAKANPTDAATAATTTPGPDSTVPPIKRSRGRPKGSKSTKVRKDKGIKKKLIGKNVDSPLPEEGTEAYASVVSAGQHLSTPVAAAGDSASHMSSQPATLPFPNLQAQQSPHNAGSTSTPGSKKRGRPKGSKNRPKAAVTGTPTTSNANAPLLPLSNPTHIESSPLAQKSGASTQQIAQGTSQGTSQGGFAAAAPTTSAATPRVDHGSQSSSNLSPASFALMNAMGAGQQASTMAPSVTGSLQQVSGVESQGENVVRKRKVGELASKVQPSAAASHELPPTAGASGKAGSPIQASQSKRRRLSKEANQTRASVNIDTSAQGTQPASPPKPNTSSNSGVQANSSTGNTESQNPVDKLPGVRTTARFGPNQRLQRQQQQQKAQALSQQSSEASQSMHDSTQQRSPSVGRVSQVSQSSQQAGAEAPANAQARQQAGFFPITQPHRSPQTFYPQQQRQSASQYGHLGNAGGNYGLGLPNSHTPNRFPPGMVKHNSGDSSMAEPSQQGLAAATRNKQGADGLQHAGYANHQSPRSSSGPSPGMNQFSPYSDGSYLNMDYVMNGQNTTNTANAAAAAAAFGGGSPLDETLTETGMRNRIY